MAAKEKHGTMKSAIGTTAKVIPSHGSSKKFSETRDFKLALLGNVDSGKVLVNFVILVDSFFVEVS